jgi:hypothetical protein
MCGVVFSSRFSSTSVQSRLEMVDRLMEHYALAEHVDANNDPALSPRRRFSAGPESVSAE